MYQNVPERVGELDKSPKGYLGPSTAVIYTSILIMHLHARRKYRADRLEYAMQNEYSAVSDLSRSCGCLRVNTVAPVK